MSLTLADVISFTVIFLFWLLTVALLSHRGGLRTGNRLLAVFIASKTLCLVHGLLIRFATNLAPLYPHAYYWGISFEFLLGPSLYLYTRCLTYSGFRVRPRHLLHLVPFALHVLFMTWRFHRFDALTKIDLIHAGAALSPFENQVVGGTIFLHLLAYLLPALLIVAQHRRRVMDAYSRLGERHLTWLASLLIFFLVIWLVSFGQNLFSPRPFIAHFVFDLLLLFFASMIVLFGLRQPEIFVGQEPPEEPKKDAKPRLSPEDRDRLVARITATMQTRKPFLNPDLTLADLSDAAGVAPRDVTWVLREALDTCFYDFVNRHRVEEAMRLLQSNSGRGTVLQVLERSGFNSKSVFNTAFKRHTGLTPTAFRGQQTAVQ